MSSAIPPLYSSVLNAQKEQMLNYTNQTTFIKVKQLILCSFFPPQYVGKVPELYWMVQSSVNLVSSILKSGTNTVLVKHFVLSDCP